MITIGQGQDQRISQFSLEQEWLESFISVPVEDLKKALDPTVWPLRVCVREFIHYRKLLSDRNGSKGKNSATGGATAVQSWMQLVLCA